MKKKSLTSRQCLAKLNTTKKKICSTKHYQQKGNNKMSLEESIKTLNESIQQLTVVIALLNNNQPKPELAQVEQD